MIRQEVLAEVMKLSREERVDLIGVLEDSLMSDDDRQRLTEAMAESERRYAEHLANPSSSVDAFEQLEVLKKRLGI